MMNTKLCCFIMSAVLSFLSGTMNSNHPLLVDVSESDGRMVLWKENSYIETDNELIFKCRDREDISIYISYDDGKSYTLQCDACSGGEYIVSPQKYSDKICIRFVSNEGDYIFGSGKKISRQFRIDF